MFVQRETTPTYVPLVRRVFEKANDRITSLNKVWDFLFDDSGCFVIHFSCINLHWRGGSGLKRTYTS